MVPVRMWESKLPYIDYTVPIMEEFLTTMSAYNVTDRMESGDLIDAYLAFHWSYYVSLVVTLAIFIMVWRMCEKYCFRYRPKQKTEIQNARLPPSWIMTCAILDQDQFPNITHIAFKALSLLFSLFFFITIDCFMMNIMSTDLVVIEIPQVIRTYQDFLDRNAKIIFMEGWDENNFFEHAPEGSLEKQLWDKRYMIRTVNVETMSAIREPILRQEMALVLRDWFGLSAASFGLGKTR